MGRGLAREAGDLEGALLLVGSLQARRGEADRNEVVEALAHLAVLDADPIDAAVAALRERETCLRSGTRTIVHHILRQATGDLRYLQAAHRGPESACEEAPAEDRTSMLENVPLHRDILRAWNEARVEEERR